MHQLRRYRAFTCDSARWEGFRYRPDDIVISAPPKCGTTWMQMLCALLVFDATSFDRALSEISPWLDMQTNDLDAVLASLEQQQHRRFIKTHVPLDGLVLDDHVTYLGIGRDPRDVAMSWRHHIANIDPDAVAAARLVAVGPVDLDEVGPPPGAPLGDRAERFWDWVDGEPGPGPANTLAALLHHLHTFWDRRDTPHAVLFHYGDLQADLPGQLRRLARVLSIDLSEDRIDQLAIAATFDRMKEHADELVPDVGNRIWRNNRQFFHSGSNGEWQDLLDGDGVIRYEQRVAALAPPDLAAWVHLGWLSSATG